jgi:hypothetical protein
VVNSESDSVVPLFFFFLPPPVDASWRLGKLAEPPTEGCRLLALLLLGAFGVQR